MSNNLFKGGVATLFMAMAVAAGAQDFQPKEPKFPSVTGMSHVLKPEVRTQPLAEQLNVKSVKLGTPRPQSEAVQEQQPVGGPRIATREGGKPGTYYGVQNGVYTLVPGTALRQISPTEYLFANHGVLGYIDRNITFHNQTTDAESFYWDFLGQDGITEKDILVHDAKTEDPTLHLKLAMMEGPDMPIAMGIIRDVDTETYDEAVENQIKDVQAKTTVKCFDDLIDSLEQWEM